MELYIEKEFLDNFYKDYHNDSIKERVKNIFVGYGSKRVFINFEKNDFEKIDNENEIFALISNSEPPNPVDDIKTHLFEQSDFKQTLVFMNDNVEWFSDAEDKGVLCFSFDNYEERIEEIIEKLHFKIDLSQDFQGWGFLTNFQSINFNQINISDGYIISGKSDQIIKNNLFQILDKLIFNKEREIIITILTKEILDKRATDDQVRIRVENIYKDLVDKFTDYKVDFSFFKNDLQTIFDFHDRTIFTNFSILDSGVGFNLKNRKKSNSQIISESIFNKYTYNRLRRNQEMQTSYIRKLRSDSFDSINFYMYPE